MLIMLPLPCPCMTRTSCFMLRITPRTLVSNVAVDGLGLRTERAHLLDGRLAGLGTPTGNDDLRALLGKGEGGGATYACEASRDQNDWLVHCSTPDERVLPITSLTTAPCLSTTLLPWRHSRLP